MTETSIPVIIYPAERYKGRVHVSLCGEDGMHVRSDPQFPLFVNGVKVRFSVHLMEYDGEWELIKYQVAGINGGVGQYPDWTALNVRRLDTGGEASQSANKKMLQLSEDIARWIAESRPDDLILGEVRRLRRKHDLIKSEEITLKARLSQVREELNDVLLATAGQEVRWATEVATQDNPSK